MGFARVAKLAVCRAELSRIDAERDKMIRFASPFI